MLSWLNTWDMCEYSSRHKLHLCLDLCIWIFKKSIFSCEYWPIMSPDLIILATWVVAFLSRWYKLYQMDMTGYLLRNFMLFVLSFCFFFPFSTCCVAYCSNFTWLSSGRTRNLLQHLCGLCFIWLRFATLCHFLRPPACRLCLHVLCISLVFWFC